MKKTASLFAAVIGFTMLMIPSAAFSQEVTGSGSFSYAYPLDLPAGRNNMGPALSLAYNSNAGNGMLGQGWSIAGLSIITRDASYPVTFDDTTDHFVFDGQRLLIGADTKYHTEQESYVWIDFCNKNASTSYWVVTLKNGTKMYYGYDDNDHSSADDGHVDAVGKSGKALVWCLSRVEDVFGNYYVVEYNEDADNGDYYPVKITWTKNSASPGLKTNTIEFSYETRTDTGPKYIPTLIEMNYRLKWITIKIDSTIARKYKIEYDYGTNTGQSRILSIREYGAGGVSPVSPWVDQSWDDATAAKLPQVTFGWQEGENDFLQENRGYGSAYFGTADQSGQLLTGDFNGDGISDIAYWGKNGNAGTSCWRMHISAGTDFRVEEWGPKSSYFGTADQSGQLLTGDFNGDGKTDIAYWGKYGANGTPCWRMHISIGTDFRTEIWAPESAYFGSSDQSKQLLTGDFNGDGKTDIAYWGKYGDGTPCWRMHISIGTDFRTEIWGPESSYFGSSDQSKQLLSGDFNGDGKTDIAYWGKYGANGTPCWRMHISTGTDFRVEKWGPGSSYFGSSDHSKQLLTGDFNGDGKTDICYWGKYGDGTPCWRMHISKGNDFRTTYWGGNSAIFGTADQSALIYAVDFNSDGKSDLCYWGLTEANGTPCWRMHISTGNNFSTQTRGTGSAYFGTSIHSKQLLPGDFTGDGNADIAYWGKDAVNGENCFRVHASLASPGRINTINLPAGGTIAIAYAPAPLVPGAIDSSKTNLPVIASKSPQHLVTMVAASDGFGNTYQTAYEYSNQLFYTGYTYEQEYLGFEYIKKIDKNSGSATYNSYTKTYYYQWKPYQGLVRKTELYDASNYKYSASEHLYNYRTDASGSKFIYKTADYSCNYNGDNSEAEKITSRLRYCADPADPDADYYDAHGNLLKIENDGDISTIDDDTVVVSEYAYNPVNNISVPLHIIKTAKNIKGFATTASEITLAYNTEYTLLTEKMIENGDNDITLKYGYDSYGNLTWVKDPRANAGEYAGYTVRYNYETNYKTYPESETNALGHSASIAYDTLMRPYRVTDANSQQWTTAYDVFSRVIKTAGPGDNIETSPAQQIFYDNEPMLSSSLIVEPVNVRTIVRQNASNSITSYTYYDGLGRLIQRKYPSKTTSADGKWITVDYFYDRSGRNYKTSVPYISYASGPGYTPPDTGAAYSENSFDAIGRVVRSYNTDGTYSQIVYEKKRIVLIDENNHISSSEINGTAMIESSYDTVYTGTVPDSSTAYYRVQTKAAWDGVSIEDSMTGNAQTTISIVTDMLGRKKSYTDKDLGYWTYDYDANNNLTSQTDAKSQTINFDYDRLNRVRHKYHGANLNSTYLYDGKNDAGEPDGLDHGYCTGMLTKVVYPDGSETYKYDERGRVTQIRKTIAGAGERIISLAYDLLNRLTRETRPDGEIVSCAYGTNGNLIGVTGNRSGVITQYATDLEYTAYGKLKSILYGNGITTTYSYYDDATGDPSNGNRTHSYRLKEIIAERDDGLEIARTTYEYDAVDNLKKKYFTDDFEGEYSEEYGYDIFNRLTFAHSTGLYGDKEYRYLPNNNISLKDGRAYDYTSARPHAVTNDERYSYSYDANGNMVSRSDGKNIVYDYENRVSNISGGNIYTYDDSGSRIKKTEGAATTYYFFGNYEETVKDGTTEVVTYYFANGQRIAQRTTTGSISELRYYHTDHLDSAVRLTDEAGDIVQSIAYDPFGKTVFASGTEGTKYQYTDQEFDEGTGFYYYGARYYDPELGRFMQADTVLAGLNRYAYCGNNPINFVDPTGHYGEYSNPGAAPGRYDDGTTSYVHGPGSGSGGGSMNGNDSAFPKDPKDGTIVKYNGNAYMYRGGWKRLVPAFNGGITGLLIALTDAEKEMIYGNGNNEQVTETGNVDEGDAAEEKTTPDAPSTDAGNGNGDTTEWNELFTRTISQLAAEWVTGYKGGHNGSHCNDLVAEGVGALGFDNTPFKDNGYTASNAHFIQELDNLIGDGVEKCTSFEQAQAAADINTGDYLVIIIMTNPKDHSAFVRNQNYDLPGIYGPEACKIRTGNPWYSHLAIAGGGLNKNEVDAGYVFSDDSCHFGTANDKKVIFSNCHIYIYSRK